ncbi:MAG: hypothetical protein IKQ31_02435 [Clostridia bacterium]|nr:hypothetical protein [Clostridia bacterium]
MENKRKPVWLIVLAVIFFPITLIYLLARPKQKDKTITENDENKAFPHVMTNKNDGNEAKEIDDYMFMDLMDEDDELEEELEDELKGDEEF